MFSFSLDKPADMQAAIAKLKEELKKAGGRLIGDSVSGEIEAEGVKGKYTVGETEIEIVIDESRYPQMVVEPYARGMLKMISRDAKDDQPLI